MPYILFDRQLPSARPSSSVLLFQTLKNALQYSFKTNQERRFIYTRLNLFDQHYCLRIELELWNSYMEIGVQQHTWPVSVHIYMREQHSLFSSLKQRIHCTVCLELIIFNHVNSM